LRAYNPGIAIGLADPPGSAIFTWSIGGEQASEGNTNTEGIGQGRVTGNLAGLKIDHAYRIPDEETLLTIYDLVEHDGLVMGGSTGVNVAGAIRMARDLGPGKTIVTVLCDHGQRYQSKIFNPEFLKERGLPAPPWMA
jgi:cysteine synthase A